MSEIVQPRRSSRVQAKLADQEKRKAEEKDNPDFENTVIKVAKKVAKKSVKKKSENVKKTTNNIEEDSKKSAPKKSKNNSKKVTKTVESVELESVPKEPKDWGISSDEEANNGDEVEAEHAASDEKEVVLPAVFRVNTEEVAKETPETDPTETNAKKSTAKKSTKTKKSKTKEPELTAAELQEMIMIKQTVLNLVTPIAVKNNCLASLEAVNKPKFEIPKLTKLGIANVKGYSTYEPHKNPWVQNGGMMNQYGGYDRDPFMSSGGFNDYGGGETGPDQPHPSIVQAVQANDLENVRRLIKHALSLPEASSVVKHKIPKQRGLSAEKQKEVNKWKAQNKLLKKQNEENVVTFKKFTSKEQALNIARFVTEEEEKHHYTKSWEWYEDTALHAAVRQGRDKIVKILLEAGADPTLKACVGDSDDQNYPIDLVQKLKSKGYSVRCYNNIEMMLTVALEFWDEASYSGISAGCSGTSRSWSHANQCKDLEGLQKQLSVVTEFCDWELLEDDRSQTMITEPPIRRSSRIKTKEAECAKLVEQKKRAAEEDLAAEFNEKTSVAPKPKKNKIKKKSSRVLENKCEVPPVTETVPINKAIAFEHQTKQNPDESGTSKSTSFNPLAPVFIPGVALHPVSVYKRKSVRKSRIVEPEKKSATSPVLKPKTTEKKVAPKKKPLNSKPVKPKKVIAKKRSPFATINPSKRSSTRKSNASLVNQKHQRKSLRSEDWGISSGSEVDPLESTVDEVVKSAEVDEIIKLPEILQSHQAEDDKENSNKTESFPVEKSTKKTTKPKKSKKLPALTAAELQEREILKQEVLNIVRPIAAKYNKSSMIDDPNKPKFELPKLTKWATANIKGLSTYEPHKNPWMMNNGYGMGGFSGFNGDINRHFSHGNFHRTMRNLMHHAEENQNRLDKLDQPHPSIVQAVVNDDLDNVRRLIKHADTLPESAKYVEVKNKKTKTYKARIRAEKKMKETDNIVTFKKFTSKEQALNVARFAKKYEVYEDNALIAAVRVGNDTMVKLLLEAGADPSLKSAGYNHQKHECAMELNQKLNNNDSKRINIEMMLTIALRFWDTADYSGCSSGKHGTNRIWFSTADHTVNKCNDLETLQKQMEIVTDFCDWTE